MVDVIWGSAGNTAWNDGANGWTVGAGAAIGSATGSILLKAGADSWAYSEVQDLGDTSSKDISLSTTDFLDGELMYIRGSATSFNKTDVIPAWQLYTAQLTESWRYVQLKLVPNDSLIP